MNTKTEEERRIEAIQGLRDLAAFLEARPELPIGSINMLHPIQEREDFTALVRLLGSASKDVYGEWYGVVKQFGPASYELYIAREKVCVKHVVGEEYVPAHTKEIVQWQCSDSIFHGKND